MFEHLNNAYQDQVVVLLSGRAVIHNSLCEIINDLPDVRFGFSKPEDKLL